ncbi:DUF4139 domain-containing protein [Gemmobacter serpentinus]|uniref:DUF4139 domain-containing protein n=1 Tax=Gemmobacter serpentinus TaxID=2652247 RepID=UPI00124F10CA|nr:DUF4139 domain-containing protein [Gemmobacter serpentinus]
MRPLPSLFSLALVALPCSLMPAWGDTITATSQVTAVTLYPSGAEVTRVLRLDLPAGQHELRIADLPQGLDPGLIRLGAAAGTDLGAFSLQQDGLAPGETVALPDLDAAVADARAARDAAQFAIDSVGARIAGFDAREGFLRGLETEATGQSVESIAALTEAVGNGVRAAREAALQEQATLPPLVQTLTEAQARLERAEAAQQAGRDRQAGKALLSIAVEQAAAGAAEVTLRHFVVDAGWRPVYDFALTRQPAPQVTLSRGVLVSQSSGEDWKDVALVLSTARPTDQSAPSDLWPELRRIGPPEPPMVGAPMAGGAMMADAVAAEVAPMAKNAALEMQGEIVTYRAPGNVSVATGVQDLRIALSEVVLPAQIEARAVPRYDRTAFLMATVTNGTEALLPGDAYYLRDGALVGGGELEMTAAGDELELAFGPIDGLRLTREMPRNSEGDAGMFSSGTARSEVAILRVENLTTEDWNLHVIDQVPYSEQDDLKITYSASPAPDETEPKGKRGLLGWHFDLAAGATQEISLETALRWPAGMELR